MKDRKIADGFACVLRDSPVWLRLTAAPRPLRF